MARNVFAELKKRGFIEQTTSEEIEKSTTPIKFYIGFDPTADSLHLGNLVGIIAIEWLKRFGHIPFAIVGGATGRIGDPSGKSVERPLLADDIIKSNVIKIGLLLEKILNRDGKSKIVVLNNNDWFKDMLYIDFLRDVGKHFRMSMMLSKESVKNRLNSEDGMSFTEFSYQILQAYDFYYLFTHHGIHLQMGGSDQWGNITAGIELSRKLCSETLYGLTFPLLTRSDGKKFGKSEEGAIWLDGSKLSPYNFYQYLIKIPDADVIKLMKMLTFLELEEIEEYAQKLSTNPNAAQKRLAEEVTRFVHGGEGVKSALAVTEGLSPGSTDTLLDASTLKGLCKEMPHFDLPKSEVIGRKFSDIAAKSALVSSKSEAVRLVQGGGAYLNNVKLDDPNYKIEQKDLIDSNFILIASGKKKKLVIRILD